MKRYDELERKLCFFGSEYEKFNLELDSAGVVDDFLATSNVNKESGAQLLETLEVELEQYENQLKELNNNSY
jgi:hypothetical protein